MEFNNKFPYEEDEYEEDDIIGYISIKDIAIAHVDNLEDVVELAEIVKVRVVEKLPGRKIMLSLVLDYKNQKEEATVDLNYLKDDPQSREAYLFEDSTLYKTRYKSYMKTVKKQCKDQLNIKQKLYWGKNKEITKYPHERYMNKYGFYYKKGKNPREQFEIGKRTIGENKSLVVGDICVGIITNITNNGAFVALITQGLNDKFIKTGLVQGDIVGYCSPLTNDFINIGKYYHDDYYNYEDDFYEDDFTYIFGFIHISQMAKCYVKNPNNIVEKGEVVKVKVLESDCEERIALSLIL